jgi:DNA polymerase-3 subunit epsilon
MPIPGETVKVHGITDEMVAGRPAFPHFAARIQALVQDAVLVAHNHKFDLEILSRELARAGQAGLRPNHPCIDTHQVESIVNSHSLGETYKRYVGAEFAGAHRSEADTAATVEVLRRQRRAHAATLPPDLEGLLVRNLEQRRNPERAERDWLDHGRRFYADGKGIVHFNFGPHRGHPIFENAETRSFLDWMLRRDFPDDVKSLVKQWLAAPPPA